MKRDLNRLANEHFDLLVVGGGIYGAFVAWDAALRGLSTALIERGDFGGATSSNSLKIIHGGLRYLQNGNLRMTRTMANERRTWMRIAPHLVHPMQCMVPTMKRRSYNRLLLSAALAVNDLISFHPGEKTDPQKCLPAGQLISAREFAERFPGLEHLGVTGGAAWYDAQMYSSERLLLAVIRAAASQGAQAANYVEGLRYLVRDGAVTGMQARDVLSGQRFEIRAGMVVTAAGGWLPSLLETLLPRSNHAPAPLSVAMNLVTRPFLDGAAIGVPSRYVVRARNGRTTFRDRLLFMTPWRGHTLVGTAHAPFRGHPDDLSITEEITAAFLDEINQAYPAADLSRDDVLHVHAGFLPVQASIFPEIRLTRENQIVDHERQHGIPGLVSILGVKYTTARHGAQAVVDLVCRKTGRAAECRTHKSPLAGGRIESFDDFLDQIVGAHPQGLRRESARHLAYHFGSDAPALLRFIGRHPELAKTLTPRSPTVRAEIVHAVREEMAIRLSDAVRRRTDLGAVGLPDASVLEICADLMAAELGWSEAEKRQEIQDLAATYPLRTGRAPMEATLPR